MTSFDPRHQRKLTLHFRRFEFKYWITPEVRFRLRKAICRYLRPDPYANQDGSYAVTNIYFDSPGMKCYYDLEAGLKNRQKIRHRYYGDDKSWLFWEIKKKLDSIVIKDRCLAKSPTGELATRLDAISRLWRLRPVAWVRYLREPWVGQGGLRITFDRNLMVARTRHTDKLSPVWHLPLRPDQEIMELKYSGSLPAWLYRIIGVFNLERQQISKYRIAVENLHMV